MLRNKILLCILCAVLLFLSGCNFQRADEAQPDTCVEGYYFDGTECVEEDPKECPTGYIMDGPICVIDDTNEDIEPIIVYFEKPEDWEDCYVYYYHTNQGDPISWENSVKMRPMYGPLGWYYLELPDDIVYARIIFNSSDGNQIPPPMEQGKVVFEDTWFYSNYTHVTDNPFE